MPDSRPEGAELVAVVRDWLKEQVLPGLDGEPQFQCRVAMSLLAMVERELRRKPGADRAELARLRDLAPTVANRGQDRAGEPTADTAADGASGDAGDLVALNRMLCARIDNGEIAVDDPRLLDHLGRVLRDALEINNPRWLAADKSPPAA